MDYSATNFYSDLPGKNLSHAYITGPALAGRLAMAVVCSRSEARPCESCIHCGKISRGIHPDASYIDKLPDKRDIVVEQIRELKKDVLILPNEASTKAYIIKNADIMNTAAQNALLAVLEEPPKHVVFILETENHMALLPTVRSRCVRLSASPSIKGMEEAVEALSNDFISAICSGNTALAEIMFRLERLEKPDLTSVILRSREKIAEAFSVQTNGAAPPKSLLIAEKTLHRANQYLEFNVGTGHVAGLMCASLVNRNGD